ncbi:pyrimidine dimer DNA glycosylase/endonuclease V [Sulfurimonas sp. HSL1-2]|uniref:pyrimidine dimer DNA glycosylase/endonuclease V n=1 Tax=Thiomicrolovo zhangzhouensis TaxID=3131933 RepID=UPI0031F8410D
MRLWSLHPKYLDAKGLVALWREALLAQNVLLGKTKGYRNHPQLIRFKQCADPAAAIACYLGFVADEADSRGYRFDRKKIAKYTACDALPVTQGQLAYEWTHLLNKLERRDPERYNTLVSLQGMKPHPLFTVVEGHVETWEVVR